MADALASDGAFTVTAITKFPQSDAAHDLKGKGVRVVEGDMTDPGSYVGYLEGMGAAFVSMDCKLHISPSDRIIKSCHEGCWVNREYVAD